LPKLAKLLKMDQSQFDGEMIVLRQNGFLSDDNKITTKGLLAFEGKGTTGLLETQSGSIDSEKLVPHLSILNCPSCNAPLDPTTASGDYLKCAYCGETFKLR